jgi:uncharacterized protein DUF664
VDDRTHKPSRDVSDPATLLLGFLDYYRSAIARKVEGLGDIELRTSRLPSGWTPLELVKHLGHMERRWLVWGFLAEPIDAPYGDETDGRWSVAADTSATELIAVLRTGGERTRAIVTAADLTDVAELGGRFNDGDEKPPPSLGWILVYVLQEYARHAGHLDIARELMDGALGE